MRNNEALYDTKIYPLMEQIMSICKAHNIPMFAVFQYANDGFCTSLKYGDGSHVLFKFLDAIAQSKEGDSINIDKFMFWVMKEARKTGHQSLVLRQLNIPEQTNAEKESK